MRWLNMTRKGQNLLVDLQEENHKTDMASTRLKPNAKIIVFPAYTLSTKPRPCPCYYYDCPPSDSRRKVITANSPINHHFHTIRVPKIIFRILTSAGPQNINEWAKKICLCCPAIKMLSSLGWLLWPVSSLNGENATTSTTHTWLLLRWQSTVSISQEKSPFLSLQSRKMRRFFSKLVCAHRGSPKSP